MSTSITSRDELVPGEVVVINAGSGTEEWLRVTATAGAGPFTSEVRPLGTWERRWLIVRGTVRRLWRRWTYRVWWPAVFWVEDWWTEWRQR